jgi:hypothetical protein
VVDDQRRSFRQLLAEEQPATGPGISQVEECSQTEPAVELALITGSEATKSAIDARGPNVPDTNQT